MRTRGRRGRGPAGAGRPSGHPGLLALAVVSILSATPAHAAQAEPLVLESKIPLGDVKGRIDHLAVDAGRERLYVAELGNGSVGIVDLKNGSVIRTLTGFHEPQGIGYEAGTDTVHIANGGDGSVRVLHGSDFAPAGAVDLGADADNVRIDSTAHQVIVGYGSGALAVIDPTTRAKLAEIPLKAHPESFQLLQLGKNMARQRADAGAGGVDEVQHHRAAIVELIDERDVLAVVAHQLVAAQFHSASRSGFRPSRSRKSWPA